MTLRVASELQTGEVVVENGSAPYEVHAVNQHQGQCQVSDTSGTMHTYGAYQLIEVE